MSGRDGAAVIRTVVLLNVITLMVAILVNNSPVTISCQTLQVHGRMYDLLQSCKKRDREGGGIEDRKREEGEGEGKEREKKKR